MLKLLWSKLLNLLRNLKLVALLLWVRKYVLFLFEKHLCGNMLRVFHQLVSVDLIDELPSLRVVLDLFKVGHTHLQHYSR
jgi:hypothetical protein